jgi:hypothetical protein
MPDSDAISQQQELLATYRRTLAHLVRQAAHYGGEVFAPPQVANGILEARVQIQQLKAILRAQGLGIADEPNDEWRSMPVPIAGDARNRNRLIQKVRTFWIDGVLQSSLQGVTPIALSMELRPASVAQPWDAFVPFPEQPVEILPPDTNIVDLFDRYGGEILILGEPGAGKTLQLLHLARVLLGRAESDPRHLLPVVLHLGSWGIQQLPLQDWIVHELNQRYDVPYNIGRPWVDTDQLLPLLDGLDEVPADQRALCVGAINQFRQYHGMVGIAVCSRTEDYDVLPTRLKIQGAVCIQPLTPQQISAYLANNGSHLAPLQRVLQDDPAVWDLARMPLLLNFMRLVYERVVVEYVPAFDSIEKRRTHLLALYVQKMFDRPRHQRSELAYTLEQTEHWLSWIAQVMMQQTQPTFLIERIQPNLLRTPGQRWLYFSFVGLAIGLVASLPAGIIGATRGNMTIGLMVALVIAVPLIRGIGRIEPFEALHWSWRNALKGIGIGLTAGLAGGIWGNLYGGSAGALILGLGTGIFGGMASGIVFGLSGHEITTRITPNEGIWRSARNALRIWLAIGLSFALGLTLLGWGIDGLFGQQSLGPGFWFVGFGLPLGMVFLAPPLALARGGRVFLQHFALRFVLWCNGVLPWRYASFLDHCVERVLLQRVGSGYIFIHRLLLEYFAALDRTQASTDSPTPPAQRERTVGV